MLGHRRLSGEKMAFKARVKQILQNQGVPQTKVQESVVNGCSDVDLGHECGCWKFGRYAQIPPLEPSGSRPPVKFSSLLRLILIKMIFVCQDEQ